MTALALIFLAVWSAAAVVVIRTKPRPTCRVEVLDRYGNEVQLWQPAGWDPAREVTR
jgi:hypothetical protein